MLPLKEEVILNHYVIYALVNHIMKSKMEQVIKVPLALIEHILKLAFHLQ
jgi:hypothetical protein